MQGHSSGKRGNVRQSALWGSGNRGGELRSNALWGKGGRGAAMACMLLLAVVVPAGAVAKDKDKTDAITASAYVPQGLLDAAAADPDKKFDVIVESAGGADKADETAKKHEGNVKRKFRSIPGASIEIKGKQLLKLADDSGISSVTEDGRVHATGKDSYYNTQVWPYIVEASDLWSVQANGGSAPATIAIVDSGVEPSLFAGRLLEQVRLTSLVPNSPGDGRGHGTFVASIAAGSAAPYAGAAPNAKLVSLDVMDDRGMALVSDVIAACDWLLANKDRLNIRVANFSLNAAQASTFRLDPLNRAVERLWLGGVVVVVAAGNYGVAGTVSGVRYSPANDPFVITVGANSFGGSTEVAPWSAYGRTSDGFRKPELVAPGRGMRGAVPAGSTMALERPDRLVSPGWMWMSGTSFAAPVVSGLAAYVAGAHPTWSPDQIKGALMAKATPLSGAPPAAGVGQVSARAQQLTNPPDANLALKPFVYTDALTGARAFDAGAWYLAATTNPLWDAATWSQSTWAESTWAESTWAESTWAESTWAESTWAESTWAESTWAESTWAESTWVE